MITPHVWRSPRGPFDRRADNTLASVYCRLRKREFVCFFRKVPVRHRGINLAAILFAACVTLSFPAAASPEEPLRVNGKSMLWPGYMFIAFNSVHVKSD